MRCECYMFCVCEETKELKTCRRKINTALKIRGRVTPRPTSRRELISFDWGEASLPISEPAFCFLLPFPSLFFLSLLSFLGASLRFPRPSIMII